MRDAAARSKSMRLALALAAVLVALAALSWWMRESQDKSADVAVASTARPIEASALELEPTVGGASDMRVGAARKAEESTAVVDASAQAAIEWGRLHLTVRSSAPHVRVTKGSAHLAARVLHTRKQRLDFESAFSAINGYLDADGLVEFNRVPFGDWMLTVKADGFDPAERSVLIQNGSIVNLDITVEPLVLAELAVVLRHPNGIPLFDAVEGPLLELVSALRLVFLAECPAIGADLPPAAAPLVQRSRFVRLEHPDQWMHATFKKAVAGWACVVLGERVLDAVPFTAGQEVVVLRVDPSALVIARCTLGVIVTDELTSAPIAGADVRVFRADGRMQPLVTDAAGRVRVEDLMPGDVRMQVHAADYASGEKRVMLSSGNPAHVDIALAPRFWIRGRMKFPASGRVAYGISAYPTETRNREASATAYRCLSMILRHGVCEFSEQRQRGPAELVG